MTIDLKNPVQIDRIELTTTKEGKPTISMFSGALDFAVLTLFESQFGWLFDVGIDPNTMEKGTAVYTRFNAHWEFTEKVNKEGNQYRNPTKLEGMARPTSAAAQKMIFLMKKQNEKLEELRGLLALFIVGTTPNPQPAQNGKSRIQSRP